MIIGITLLANLIQGRFEKLLIYIFLLFNPRDKNFLTVINKNLEGHSKRN